MKIGFKPCRAFLLADACNNSSHERNAWRSLPTCDRMAEAHVRLSQMPIARMHKAMHGWYSAPHGCTTRRMHAHVWQLSTRITLAEKSCWMCRFPFHEINALICACVMSASIWSATAMCHKCVNHTAHAALMLIFFLLTAFFRRKGR